MNAWGEYASTPSAVKSRAQVNSLNQEPPGFSHGEMSVKILILEKPFTLGT